MSSPPPDLGPRYTALQLIGEGGAGLVWRAQDHVLKRHVAVKVLREDVDDLLVGARRLTREAEVLAALQHPGVVPIYDMGELPDGRPWYAMKEIVGRTLKDLLRAVRRGAAPELDLPRLIDVLRRSSEAVAAAHAAGVLHRDLKPQNIMVGAWGEVVVLDWGLARALTRGADEPSTQRSDRSSEDTQDGSVTGTPAYMSPEQITEPGDTLTPAADVYALGAIGYEILAGRPPYAGAHVWDVVTQVIDGPPPPMLSQIPRADPGLRALAGLIDQAMARAIADRPAHAGVYADALAGWLAGAHRRAEALRLVGEADQRLPRVAERRAQAAALRARAVDRLTGVRPFDPVDLKVPAWEDERQAEALDREARAEEREWVFLLRQALTSAPDLAEAHSRLARWHRERHEAALARQDAEAAAEEEAGLCNHDRGEHVAWLLGDGRLDLHTDPPGARATLYRYVEDRRRLKPLLVADLGPTPIREHRLAMGSYLVELTAPGCVPVRYPVHIGRTERWSGVAPGESAARPVALPPEGALGPDEIYVPPGWTILGGDPQCPTAPPRGRAWVDGYIIQRVPVTNQDYLRFLNALVARGEAERALAHAPQLPAAGDGRRGALLVAYAPGEGFSLTCDGEGDAWLPNMPVVNVSWHDAVAYAEFRAEDGLGWRLPTEAEWEKAARGVDGRFFPWGNHFDATFCVMRDSHAERPMLAEAHAPTGDESPYGVLGLAGNVRDWCADAWRPTGMPESGGPNARLGPPPRVYKGGGWLDHAVACRAAGRAWTYPVDRFSRIGLRLVRPWPGPTPG